MFTAKHLNLHTGKTAIAKDGDDIKYNQAQMEVVQQNLLS